MNHKERFNKSLRDQLSRLQNMIMVSEKNHATLVERLNEVRKAEEEAAKAITELKKERRYVRILLGEIKDE